jgi:hypothetical protein
MAAPGGRVGGESRGGRTNDDGVDATRKMRAWRQSSRGNGRTQGNLCAPVTERVKRKERSLERDIVDAKQEKV